MESEIGDNIIDQKAIGDLLCGYHFHIPTYQRGYRWTKRQVVDLCNDLLEYALRPMPEGASTKAFYSLQPLVVKYRDENSFDVIDGQQRLTTIYILFRFLMAELYPTPERLERANNEIDMYYIIYDTRDADTRFIRRLGSWDWENDLPGTTMDIDTAHIYNAYQYMKKWLYPESLDDKESSAYTCRRFVKEGMDSDEIARKLLTLLKNKKDTEKPEGNAQFIWYQLSPVKDAIEEFIVENKGKIGLTDTERIRALFLCREDKNNEVDAAQQIRIAKDWDEIETTLHDPDFWSFISTDEKEDGRISILFQYIYNVDAPKDKKTDLYRFYERKFAEDEGNVALKEWDRILEAFRMLKNWYKDAYLYNTIGLLTRNETSLNTIAGIYYRDDVKSTADFIWELNQIVNQKCLPKTGSEVKEGEEPHIKICNEEKHKYGLHKGDNYIDLNYDEHRDKVRSLLLFMNIRTLCEQIENHRKTNKDYCGNEYRFAFDLFDDETWDVEHIDSATTNKLKSDKDKEIWLKYAEDAIKHFYKKEYPIFIADKEKFVSGEIDFSTFHKNVIDITEAESDDEEVKNWIGNLTLLNADINRGYGNAIFAAKCMKINEKVNAGAFVPVCTRMVFYKAIPKNENSASRLEWGLVDKKAYHDWMVESIINFKELYPIKN